MVQPPLAGLRRLRGLPPAGGIRAQRHPGAEQVEEPLSGQEWAEEEQQPRPPQHPGPRAGADAGASPSHPRLAPAEPDRAAAGQRGHPQSQHGGKLCQRGLN